MDVIRDRNFRQISWSTIVLFALGFWLSGSLVLDAVIIPSLSAAGMMSDTGFASAGYLIFGLFNRIELLCGALVLTSFLVFSRHHNFNPQQQRWAIFLALLMLAIAAIYTYVMTPQMSALGLQLDSVESQDPMSTAMISIHWVYWFLEATKLIAGATLLRWSYRNSCTLD